ncbi:MAG: glucose-6-phosphate isomerase, partial [Clostridia bacterium]|nr:glucose-6-phosphate isomerase [Clostridia bacterium]
MVSWNNMDTLKAYQALAEKKAVDLPEAMSGESGAARVANYKVPMSSGLTFNYASRPVDDDILETLQAFADEAQLTGKFAELYNGAVINTGE